jgi:hypothetical protein
MPKKQEQLWSNYLSLESKGLRRDALLALDHFISHISQAATADWEAWVYEVAERVVDHDETLPIRHPLFRYVIFPVLHDGHQKGLPNCSRWLAGFDQQLYQCRNCQMQLSENERSAVGLLAVALRIDSNDERAAQRLIENIARRLEHTLHELPIGVLYAMDGATPQECLELQSELAEFDHLVERFKHIEQYSALIEECEFHFRAYRNYLISCIKYPDYATYLAAEEFGR